LLKWITLSIDIIGEVNMAKDKSPTLDEVNRFATATGEPSGVKSRAQGLLVPNNAPSYTAPTVQSTNLEKMMLEFSNMGALNPLGLSSLSVEAMLGKFKNTLLGTKQESELDSKATTLLQKGSDMANRLIARINAAQAAQNSPGAAAQTRTKQSLLG
jgi:hypothetical protein